MAAELPPLPKSLADAVHAALGAGVLPPGGHAGLVWERYPRLWEAGRIPPAKGRQEFLAAFAKEYRQQRGPGEARLKPWHERLVEARLWAGELRLRSAFATDLGAAHPSENGFRFDPLLGVPWIPGTALKGLARAAAVALGESPGTIERVLGTDAPDRSGERGATRPGRVRFVGAWPQGWPELKVELISPHHPRYQDDQGRPLPEAVSGDRQRGPRRERVASFMEEPVPVAFLAVAPGVRFTVYLGLTARGDEAALRVARAWLKVGLEHLGVGGKTASGMGLAEAAWTDVPELPDAAAAAPAVPGLTVHRRADGGPWALIVTGQIGAFAPAATAEQAAAALGVRPNSLNTVELRLGAQTRGRQPTGAGVLHALRAAVEAVPLAAELAVLCFAPIPVGMALGRLLGDKRPVQVLDFHRSTGSWAWPGGGAPLGLQSTTDRPKRDVKGVVVLLHLSGTVNDGDVPDHLQGLPRMVVQVADPAPGRIRSAEQLSELTEGWRGALSKLRSTHGAQPVHLLPASSLSANVEIGRAHLQVDPDVHVYQLVDGRFEGAVTLTAAGPVPMTDTRSPANLLVMVALEEELVQLLDVLGAEGHTPVPIDGWGHDHLYELPQGRLVVRLVGGMGPSEAQAATEQARQRWSPRGIVWVGIAAALKDDLRLCDVVVATQVTHYDAQAKAASPAGGGAWVWQRRPEAFQADSPTAKTLGSLHTGRPDLYRPWSLAGQADLAAELAAAGDAQRQRLLGSGQVRPAPEVRAGHVASGGFVAAAEDFQDFLKTGDAGFLACEMESAGLAWSVERSPKPVPWAVIRGISDAGGKAGAGDGSGPLGKAELDQIGGGALRRVAMRNASRYLKLAWEAGLLRLAER
jgi:CRISPR-associated protein Cmr6